METVNIAVDSCYVLQQFLTPLPSIDFREIRGLVVSDIRYNTDANVVNGLKNDSSYEFIGEVILKINVV